MEAPLSAPPPPLAPVLSPYGSARGRGRVLVALLAACAALALVAIFSDALSIAAFDRAIGGETMSEAEAARIDLRQSVLALIQLAAFIATAVFFILFLHRAHKNLTVLGARGMKYSPGWAVGGWFVPFLNLVRPFQVTREIWQASDPTPEIDWRGSPVPAIVGLWWGAYIAESLMGNVVARMNLGQPTFRDLKIGAQASIAQDALEIAAAILAIQVIRGIIRRQDERRRRQEAAEVFS